MSGSDWIRFSRYYQSQSLINQIYFFIFCQLFKLIIDGFDIFFYFFIILFIFLTLLTVDLFLLLVFFWIGTNVHWIIFLVTIKTYFVFSIFYIVFLIIATAGIVTAVVLFICLCKRQFFWYNCFCYSNLTVLVKKYRVFWYVLE